MYGNWLRVSPAELEQVRADLPGGWQMARAIEDAEGEKPPGECRWHTTDKTWHALDFLLDRQGFPVSLVTGEQCFVDLPDDEDELLDVLDDPSVSWGYGPPSYLTPEQVAVAAEALAALTGPDLTAGVDPAELAREQIYPQVWDRPGELEWAVHALPGVREYFAAAAAKGDAVICWIS